MKTALLTERLSLGGVGWRPVRRRSAEVTITRGHMWNNIILIILVMCISTLHDSELWTHSIRSPTHTSSDLYRRRCWGWRGAREHVPSFVPRAGCRSARQDNPPEARERDEAETWPISATHALIMERLLCVYHCWDSLHLLYFIPNKKLVLKCETKDLGHKRQFLWLHCRVGPTEEVCCRSY